MTCSIPQFEICYSVKYCAEAENKPIFKAELAHTSLITSKRCIQQHGEYGRVDRWPSALGWWCRRHRACHSSCNWGGMPGLAGPFHLHPAVRWETQKIQELIMSLLGFCSAVWGWNHPPWPSSSSPRPLHATPSHPSPPASFNSPTPLIPFFFIYPSHSLSHPCYSPILSFSTLACFTSHLHQPPWMHHYQPL